VKVIILLAKTLNLKVVAEGVETKEQLDFLKKEGYDYVQGFYIGKPMKEEELFEFLGSLGQLH